jgi:lipoprotein NlpI
MNSWKQAVIITVVPTCLTFRSTQNKKISVIAFLNNSNIKDKISNMEDSLKSKNLKRRGKQALLFDIGDEVPD